MQVFEQIYISALSTKRNSKIDLLTNHKFVIVAAAFLLVLSTSYTSIHAQNLWKLNVEGIADGESFNAKSFSKRSEIDSVISSIYSKNIANGYLLTRIDTQSTGTLVSAKVTLGNIFFLSKNNYNQGTFIDESRVYSKRKKPSLSDVSEGAEYKLRILENEGYPFASVILDSLKQMDSVNYEAFWRIRKGPFVTLDSLVFLGNDKLPERYLRYYLQLKLKNPYSEEKIIALNRKLSQLAFLQIVKPPEVLFRENKATVYFHLNKKKNNYFNGILGIRPNDQTGRINITGDVEIKLQNALNRAEDIQLTWRRLQPQTQDLLLFTKIPNIVGLPLGIDGKLNIYRRDSTFSSVLSGLGLSSFVASGVTVRAFYERFRSSGIGQLTGTVALRNVNYNLYGLGLEVDKLDYLLNPRKGISLRIDLAAGQRNQQGTETSSLDSRGTMGRLEWRSEFFIPTFKRQTVRLNAEARAVLINNPGINEVYRIGGIRNIRGIDEESIFANRWALLSLEYRFLLDKSTALYGFFDQAYYENSIENLEQTDRPYGFGVGFNLKTGGGIFTFNYALAQQFENPILVRNAKISFGFRNLF